MMSKAEKCRSGLVAARAGWWTASTRAGSATRDLIGDDSTNPSAIHGGLPARKQPTDRRFTPPPGYRGTLRSSQPWWTALLVSDGGTRRASVILRRSQSGPAIAITCCTPSSCIGDPPTGAAPPQATRNRRRPRTTPAESSVARSSRSSRLRKWLFGGDGRQRAGGGVVHRDRCLRCPPPSTSRAPCGPIAAVVASCWAPAEAAQILIIYMIRATTTMTRDGTTDEGAIDGVRPEGRAGDAPLHVLDRLEQ